jgi:ribose 5-phosphate isomerase A
MMDSAGGGGGDPETLLKPRSADRMETQEALKQKAAFKAVEFIESGMVVGLGTGSTAEHAVKRIGQLLKSGELSEIVGIPTSIRTEKLARTLDIPLVGFETHQNIDLTIDGADEVDSDLNLIKGGGGALLREKVVAQASRRNIIAVDESKHVPQLGTRWALPIEVVPFARHTETKYLGEIGGAVTVRTSDDGTPFSTDQDNLILDTQFGRIRKPAELAAKLNERAGIVEHGLFLNLATDVIVAGEGGIKHLTR